MVELPLSPSVGVDLLVFTTRTCSFCEDLLRSDRKQGFLHVRHDVRPPRYILFPKRTFPFSKKVRH